MLKIIYNFQDVRDAQEGSEFNRKEVVKERRLANAMLNHINIVSHSEEQQDSRCESSKKKKRQFSMMKQRRLAEA